MTEDALTLSHPKEDAETIAGYIRAGRFQRSLALLTAVTSVVSGLEVAPLLSRCAVSKRQNHRPFKAHSTLPSPTPLQPSSF